MKTRLSSTIWMLVLWTTVALFGVLGLAYEAGVHSGGASLTQGGASGSGGMEMLIAAGVAVFTSLVLTDDVAAPRAHSNWGPDYLLRAVRGRRFARQGGSARRG